MGEIESHLNWAQIDCVRLFYYGHIKTWAHIDCTPGSPTLKMTGHSWHAPVILPRTATGHIKTLTGPPVSITSA